ncbi:MAG: response regulator [Acidobacteria bacterium]|nr:response regulator [Acidobacteriota bacterium]MBW4045622.1 response regulator [Acidobacteriota bacterium]
MREDAPIRIFCFIEDLFVLAKIQETARKLGIKVGFVKADKDIVAKLAGTSEEDRPSLIVFDLNNANAKPLTLIPRIKSKLKRGTSVIGFLSHIQGDLKAKAIEAGCDMVMPRSAFSQNLPNLLRRHGLEEELEAVEA